MTENEAIEAIQFDLEIGGEIHSQVLRDAVDVAIQALEKQIPMKLMMAYDDKSDSNWCSCSACYSGLGWDYGKHYEYCMNCGQKLDWGDEE